jgi:hypothetical protein
MTDITAFNTPHRPDTTGVRYTLWTTNHDQVAGDLTPCASRLYRWLLQQAAGGVKQTVDLEDFQQSTVCRKRQTGYHIKHIVRSFKELVKAELACVMRWYGHCKRIFDVIVRHTGAVKQIPPLGRKSNRKYGEVLGGSKKFQTEAETAIPPYSIHSLQKIAEQSHPPHPVAVFEKGAKEEEEEKERQAIRQALGEGGFEINVDQKEEIELETDELKDLGEGHFSAGAKNEEKLDFTEEEEKERQAIRQALGERGFEIDIDQEEEIEPETDELKDLGEGHFSAGARNEEKLDFIEEEEEEEEIDLKTDEPQNFSKRNFRDSDKHEEKLDLIDVVGIRLNAQLESLVRGFTLDEIKQAIAYYLQTKRIKGTKGQVIKRPAGWFTDCLRQNWCATKPMEQTREEEEFTNWYSEAIASGLVEDLSISWLTKDYNQDFIVRQRKPGLYGSPYTLISWKELRNQTTEPLPTEQNTNNRDLNDDFEELD